jgi:hypothetical protein
MTPVLSAEDWLSIIRCNAHFCVSHVIDEPPRRQWWQHSPGLCTVANRLDGRLIESGPSTMVKDLASLRVSLLR